MRLVFALLLAPALAHADSLTASTQATDAVDHRFAVAVNEPFGWIGAHAFGLSGYVALDPHQVIHLNIANWSHDRSFGLDDLEAGVIDGTTNNYPFGRLTDVGLAWMYFPRRAYDGFSFEAGALVRIDRSTDSYRDDGDLSDYSNYADRTTTIGARAMVGWSWLGWNLVFVSAQAGISIGREFGTQTETELPDGATRPMTIDVNQTTIAGEGMVRFGVLLNP